MVFKSRHAGVPLLASPEWALERLLVSVGDFMSLEVSLGNKLVSALVADERPLSRMRTQVSLEVACLNELLEALLERADKYFGLVFRSGRFEHSYILEGQNRIEYLH